MDFFSQRLRSCLFKFYFHESSGLIFLQSIKVVMNIANIKIFFSGFFLIAWQPNAVFNDILYPQYKTIETILFSYIKKVVTKRSMILLQN